MGGHRERGSGKGVCFRMKAAQVEYPGDPTQGTATWDGMVSRELGVGSRVGLSCSFGLMQNLSNVLSCVCSYSLFSLTGWIFCIS